jgi:acyl dehydratase
MLAYPHERFAVEVTLTPAMVAAYAAAAGETNPVHTTRRLPPRRATDA